VLKQTHASLLSSLSCPCILFVFKNLLKLSLILFLLILQG
jgi:hypothetical protein